MPYLLENKKNIQKMGEKEVKFIQEEFNLEKVS